MMTVEALESIADQINLGNLDAARAGLDAAEPTDETRDEIMFLRGYLQEHCYEREEALATYEALLEENPDHTEAAFRAALLRDQGGDEEAAIELYRRCTEKTPARVNALLNLAVIYEERGALLEAEAMLKSVLAEHPNHVRARQFLKSVESSYTMAYDEQSQVEREGYDGVLDVPVSDFELSVRSRNCLKQMNIRTLGDLLRITEPELLSYRNFGETSLNEIRAMLTQKGLKLGQALQPAEQPAVQRLTPVMNDTTTNLRRPIAELELSVRSRKCLQRLGVLTLGELASRSEAELIALKNFGHTSLNEIKQQLATFGLSLRLSDSMVGPSRLPPDFGAAVVGGMEFATGPASGTGFGVDAAAELVPEVGAEPAVEGGPEPSSEPTMESGSEPAVESGLELGSEPAVEGGLEPSSEPSLEPALESDVEPSPEPRPELSPEPSPEADTEEQP